MKCLFTAVSGLCFEFGNLPHKYKTVHLFFSISCPLDQKWSAFDGLPFPPTAKSQPRDRFWMSESQETMVNIYGWTACAILIGYVVIFFGSNIFAYMRSWVQGVLTRTGTQ